MVLLLLVVLVLPQPQPLLQNHPIAKHLALPIASSISIVAVTLPGVLLLPMVLLVVLTQPLALSVEVVTLPGVLLLPLVLPLVTLLLPQRSFQTTRS
jgi:hypothetical protein